jgi:hypothetical protein
MFYRFEGQLLGLLVYLGQILFAVRYLLALIAVAVVLVWQRVWVVLGAYILLLLVAARMTRLNKQHIDLESEEQDKEREDWVRRLRIPSRVALSLGATILSVALFGVHPLQIFTRSPHRSEPQRVSDSTRAVGAARFQDGPEVETPRDPELGQANVGAVKPTPGPREVVERPAITIDESSTQVAGQIAAMTTSAWISVEAIVDSGSATAYTRAATILQYVLKNLLASQGTSAAPAEIRTLIDETKRRLDSLTEACKTENAVNATKRIATIPCPSRQ